MEDGVGRTRLEAMFDVAERAANHLLLPSDRREGEAEIVACFIGVVIDCDGNPGGNAECGNAGVVIGIASGGRPPEELFGGMCGA